ncbi:MAG: penicillin-binding protein activator, partial [Gammaproteobacteria bacterium]|nr:penicillin-binding protein activator [Gammaproteobacteria bacterium]
RAYMESAATAQPPQRQEYQLRAADALLRGQQLDQAQRLLQSIDVRGLSAPLAARRQMLLAQLALQRREPAQALAVLPAAAAGLPSRLRVRIDTVRAQAYLMAGNPLASARTRVQMEPLLQSSAEALRQNHQALWQALLQVPETALKQAQNAPPPDVLSGWLALAYIAKTARTEPARFPQRIAQWQTLYPRHPAAGSVLQSLQQQYQQARHYPRRLALLLPLSGRFAPAGAAVRDGFLAAYYNQPPGVRRPVIRIYDTGTNPGGVAALYQQAIRDGADFVVGPLDRASVTALAESGTPTAPVLALNYLPHSVPSPAGFYQFGLSPLDEARQVAERASLDGLTRALAIVPDNDWGARVLQAFRDRFQQLGGMVLNVVQYNPQDNDFSRPVLHLLGLNEAQARELLRRHPPQATHIQPGLGADFVFMAAFPRQARLIRPQMRFYNAGKLPVYATSEAYAGRVDRQADLDLDGVTFCDMPWTLSTGTGSDPLRKQIARLWPQSPSQYTRLYALGVDAYNLIPYLQLLHDEPYQRYSGETGELYMNAQNRIHRTLLWARFSAGVPRLLGYGAPNAAQAAAGQ